MDFMDTSAKTKMSLDHENGIAVRGHLSGSGDEGFAGRMTSTDDLGSILSEVDIDVLRTRLSQAWDVNQQLGAELLAHKILTKRLQEIVDRRHIRLALRLEPAWSVLMPEGSRRGRFTVACFDAWYAAMRALLHSWRHLVGTVRNLASPTLAMSKASDAEEWTPACHLSPESFEKLAAAGETNTASAAVDSADTSWMDECDVPYCPASWQIERSTGEETRFLNLLILSSMPRSGSTLLQRLCNARKGTLIWGEHKGVLSQFARIYTEVASFSAKGGDQREKFFASNESPNFWIAIMCSELPYVQNAIVRSARMLLNSLYAQYRESHDIVGFKEVRYGMDEAALLRWCYPEARMFLLVRHPCDAWNSTPRDWYSLEEFIEKWNKHTRDFLVLSRTDPNCRLIRYEDIVRQDARTMQIIRETARVTDEQMKPVLAKKLGSKHHGVSDADREAITEGCREIMELFDYR